MDKQKEVYREEAYELLAELEISLLELEETPDDAEQIGRVFGHCTRSRDQGRCPDLMILQNLLTT
ncbi:MAG TPA: hypothetical protein ENK58_09240 [Desulfobacterales bacterium]|nr:hypothetical protein [Desulfobacterales bacterium]